MRAEIGMIVDKTGCGVSGVRGNWRDTERYCCAIGCSPGSDPSSQIHDLNIWVFLTTPGATQTGMQQIQNRVICRLSPFIFHLSSFIFHQSSFIFHLSSFVVHRSSFTVHLSSFVFHRSSCIVHISSLIVHLSSFVFHL